MGSELVGGIGLVGSILGIWQFAADNIPDVVKSKSTYRIQVGLDDTKGSGDKKLSNAGGNLVMIKTYNNNGELIGSGGGGKVKDGGYADFSAEQTGTQQSITTEFYAGDDAICIAYISATMDEGSKWGWVGDWGYTCGLNWFPSGYRLQNEGGDDDKVTSPRCTWIDKDHTHDFKASIIGITWPDFYHKSGDDIPKGNGKSSCGKGFRAWANEGDKQMLPAKKKKRGPRLSQRSDDRLVISSGLSHNATEVCESETSWGPDFVSKEEGMHCNMETHEVTPLCGNGVTEDCFDTDGNGGPAMVHRNGKRSLTNPSKVIRWE
ncbi:hypothetical protein JX265_005849 [Neoarthrinium moseri]|uniref:Uncharacterized protein n=1 Tax=Neoarthrinium moseri TaxID=1658444 RepID=A0A9P9WNJ5_9PEZI|nr:hypothetical protein JX266_009833 [Neoarthrinium moseri]KAI1871863.1 hypothetical protein JX265_005849 [Neoarthrinium moseri]